MSGVRLLLHYIDRGQDEFEKRSGSATPQMNLSSEPLYEYIPITVFSLYLRHLEFFRLHARCLGPLHEPCCNRMMIQEERPLNKPKVELKKIS